MSTPSLAIRHHLVRLGRRQAGASAVLGAVQHLAPAAGLAFATAVIDNLVALPEAVRLIALIALIALTVRGAWLALRPLLTRITPERTARLVEDTVGIPDNLLINGCQFSADSETARRRSKAEAVFIATTMSRASTAMQSARLAEFYQVRPLLRWTVASMVGCSLLLAYAIALPDRAANAAARLLLPLTDVPPLGAVLLHVDPAADLIVDEGSSLTIHIRMTAADGRGDLTGIVPEVVRTAGTTPIACDLSAGEKSRAVADGAAFSCTLSALSQPLVFRVHAAGSWSPCIRVRVLPPPMVTDGTFIVTSPAYAGATSVTQPGPPASLTTLPGSQVQLSVRLDREVPALSWQVGGVTVPLTLTDARWSGSAPITAAGPYELRSGTRVVARGVVQLAADAPPTVSLAAEPDAGRNMLVSPGVTLSLVVNAGDDLGLADMQLGIRDGEALKAWRYLGPPGSPSARERLALELNPLRFVPGRTYVIEATASDRLAPTHQQTRSAPLVLRVRTLAELSLPSGDPRTAAFLALKEALALQLQARGVSATISANLVDIQAHKGLGAQAKVQREAQHRASDRCAQAGDAFGKAEDERTQLQVQAIATDAHGLERDHLPLVETDPKQLPIVLTTQDELIARITAVLGGLADQLRTTAATSQTPADGQRQKLTQLKDDLAAFALAQERILERSKTLADKSPADLTDGDRKVLGELANQENAWAKFLESKVSDLSKNPPQDFSDGSMAAETNAVFQEMKLAADALTRSAVELAVPREQSGLELAKEMVHNLEKWLMNAPDTTKWSMEDAQKPADVPVAELPAEQEDIVGDLLDKEEKMTDAVEDVSSAWMDSIDKGAGWDAGDGPISNMSAKGITGNILPNQSEIAGRSGEGRTGRSNGQFVQNEAVGKQGRDTPTRLTDTPFEKGSVKDSSKEQPNGATGGGKVAGTSAEGLVGRTPPPAMKEPLARLTGAQTAIRQKAGALALQLRNRKLSSGDLETAVTAMDEMQNAAQSGNVTALRQRYAEALDALGDAKRAVVGDARMQRENSVLPEKLRSGLTQGVADGVPAGYEELVGSYFQTLSGSAAPGAQP